MTSINSSKMVVQNIVFVNTQIVILQVLRAGYLTEQALSNDQAIKNFRTSAILDTIRNILEELAPYMKFLAECQEGNYNLKQQQLIHINQMIENMDNFYKWTIEEVRLKNQRISLMKLEDKWN